MSRLRAVIIAMVGSVAIISLLSVIYHLGQPGNLKKSSFSATRIVMRATLLEYNSDSDDPLRGAFVWAAFNCRRIWDVCLDSSGVVLASTF